MLTLHRAKALAASALREEALADAAGLMTTIEDLAQKHKLLPSSAPYVHFAGAAPSTGVGSADVELKEAQLGSTGPAGAAVPADVAMAEPEAEAEAIGGTGSAGAAVSPGPPEKKARPSPTAEVSLSSEEETEVPVPKAGGAGSAGAAGLLATVPEIGILETRARQMLEKQFSEMLA